MFNSLALRPGFRQAVTGYSARFAPCLEAMQELSFPLGPQLLAREWPPRESRLPVQERIGRVVDDIPDIGGVCLVQTN
jgi:hypothetical protein